jgi:hypothetical protein
MKKFEVTYYNSVRKTENSIIAKARSLESARAEEERAIAVMKEWNPFVSVKSVIEVA